MPFGQGTISAIQGMFGKKEEDLLGKLVDKMEEDDFLKEVNDVFDMVQQKYTYERQWYLNLAFLMGQQWVKWSNKLKKIYEPKVPEWRVRHVANDIMPAF